MIEIKENPLNGSGFDTVHTFESWKVAFITKAEQYGEIRVIKRHVKTDEVFLLIKGSAMLYTSGDGKQFITTCLENDKLYVVKKNTWHHLKVSDDAMIMVVENSNTDKTNSESRVLMSEEIKEIM